MGLALHPNASSDWAWLTVLHQYLALLAAKGPRTGVQPGQAGGNFGFGLVASRPVPAWVCGRTLCAGADHHGPVNCILFPASGTRNAENRCSSRQHQKGPHP